MLVVAAVSEIVALVVESIALVVAAVTDNFSVFADGDGCRLDIPSLHFLLLLLLLVNFTVLFLFVTSLLSSRLLHDSFDLY